MSRLVVVTAVGKDQPGIVAALAGAVLEIGGNLDDATMTRLHGAFATMLSVQLPNAVTLEDIRAALAPIGERLGLFVTAEPIENDEHTDTPPDHVITVYGADKPGIVHAVATRLAEQGVNITDMDTRVAGLIESPIYVMLLEVAANGRDLNHDLDSLRKELGVDISVQSLETEAL